MPATTARQFALDTSDREFDNIASMPLSVRARHKRLLDRAADIASLRVHRSTRNNELGREIADLQLTAAMLERDIRRSGRDAGHHAQDDDDGQTVFVKSPELARVKAQIAALKAERDALTKDRLPDDYMAALTEALRTNVSFTEAKLPPVQVAAGETPSDALNRAKGDLKRLQIELERIWRAPITVEETVQRALAEVRAMAKPPGFGAIRRGWSHSPTGERRVANPHARINWPKESHGAVLTPSSGRFLETINALPYLLWADLENQCGKIERQIRETFNDEGAISAADKPTLIAATEAAILHEWRVVVQLWFAALDSGYKDATLPNDVPVEALLGVEPFAKAAHMAVVEDDLPATDDQDAEHGGEFG